MFYNLTAIRMDFCDGANVAQCKPGEEGGRRLRILPAFFESIHGAEPKPSRAAGKRCVRSRSTWAPPDCSTMSRSASRPTTSAMCRWAAAPSTTPISALPNATIGNRNCGIITGAGSSRIAEFAVRLFL